jgi:large subunit ribosomal protein LP1
MVSKQEHDELCCVYAGLLLFDEGLEITAEKLSKVIAASGNSVEGYYTEFFGKYLASVDLKSLISNAGAGAAPAQATQAAQPVAEKKEDKKKEKKEEKPVEEEEAGGFGDLFG